MLWYQCVVRSIETRDCIPDIPVEGNFATIHINLVNKQTNSFDSRAQVFSVFNGTSEEGERNIESRIGRREDPVRVVT